VPKRNTRVFLDANALFSAAYADASDLLVFFELARAGVIELTASIFVIEEARRNITLKRPGRVAVLEGLITELSPAAAPLGEHITIAQAAGLPPKDVPILAAALAAEADLLVSGDRAHFGRLFGRSIGRLSAQRPADALTMIISAQAPKKGEDRGIARRRVRSCLSPRTRQSTC